MVECVAQRSSRVIASRPAQRPPCFGRSADRDEGDLRRAVPIALHGIVVEGLLASFKAIAAIERAMQLRADQPDVPRDDGKSLAYGGIGMRVERLTSRIDPVERPALVHV